MDILQILNFLILSFLEPPFFFRFSLFELTTMASNGSSSSITQSFVDQTQNPSSIYYIHPSDHSTLKLVTTPFNGTGFGDWKRSIIIGLVSKNKLSFVDGSLPKSADSSPDLKAWERCNTMVIGWLMTAVERCVARSIMYYNTAREIWTNLEDRVG